MKRNPFKKAVELFGKRLMSRKTSIICSIGQSNTKEFISEILKAGMNIARMNFSHGSHEHHL
jgi:pyruvate kinase